MPSPSPAPIIGLIENFRRSQAMFTATELGIFDLLADGPATAQDLAARSGTHPEALSRLLYLCANLGLVTVIDGRFANTEVTNVYLVRRSPQAITGYVEYSRRALWQLWAKLPDAVREGTHRWNQAFGGQGELFSHYYKTEAEKRQFLMGMHAFGLISSPQIVEAVDLGAFTHLVDLGGATGHFALEASRRFPRLRCTLFDLPQCIPLAEEMLAGSRVETLGGDFFGGDLPSADLYALGRILHDWTEEKIKKLLERIHAALPPGGGILVLEKLVEEDNSGPAWALLQDINMLVATEGRERKLSEYQELLEAAGFSDVKGYSLPGSPLDAILARRL
jgi:acetylserotonin O-methyltransferase